MNHEERTGTVLDAWRDALKEKGYEPEAVTRRSCLRFALLSRAWRRILRHTKFKRFAPVRALELGCGGGKQLVPLYVNGWHCTGIDVSLEVLARAQMYTKNVDDNCRARGTIEYMCQDFLDFDPGTLSYDLTFHFGVLEHFLDDEERVQYLKKMFDCTRPGGFIVSAVPSGSHPLREEQRENGLGGYVIPEINYSAELLREEMMRCGAGSVQVLPHNLFAYLRLRNERGAKALLHKFFFYLMQLPVFQSLLPSAFLNRHAYWFIAIAKKPE